MNHILFSKEDCDYIKSFFDILLSKSGDEPKYFTYNNTKVRITKNVKGMCHDIHDTSLINFVTKKLEPLKVINISSQTVSIIQYSEGDYFGKHRDLARGEYGAAYKTCVIQLSDETEYSGGELCIEDIPQTRTQGAVILFPSQKEHEVKKLISGTRYSLTIFLKEQDFNIPKTIL